MITYAPINGEFVERARERFAAPISAVPTPWPLWNEACGGMGGKEGLALGWHVLIAGGSGGSKTMTALNIAAHAARAGEAVTVHSLEMRWDEVMHRIAAIVSGVDAWKLAPGKWFSRSAWDEAAVALDEIRGSVISNESEIRDLKDLLEGIRITHERDASRVHIIDYLQLAWTRDASTQYDRITEVSHEVRAKARSLGIVTVGLSQLNRSGNSADQKPRKEAMMGSSSLENDADQVVVIDHTRRRNVTDAAGKAIGWMGWLDLAKNRHGPTGVEVPTMFDGNCFRIRQRLDDEILDSERPVR